MSHLFDEEHDDSWRYERFITTIQQRAGVSWAKAEQAAQATLATLAERISSGAARDLARDLPSDVARWLGPRGDGKGFDAVEFVRRVAEREGADPATAEDHGAIEAVLETLAERIAGGEVDDLAASLPEELRPPLERGRERTGGKAQRMSLDEFVAHVAGREGVSTEDALDHAQAVFTTLREAIPDKEWSDLLAELPRAYAEALT